MCYKEMQRKCPHHELPRWQITHIFYNGLRDDRRSSIDAAAGGSFLHRGEDEAATILENMTSNSERWTDERGTPRGGGIHQIEEVDKLASKFDLLSKQISAFMIGGNATSAPVVAAVESEGNGEYLVGEVSTTVDQASALFYNPTGNAPFPPRSPTNPTYTPNNRNHPNFSYRGTNPQFQQGQAPVYQQQQQPQYQQPQF